MNSTDNQPETKDSNMYPERKGNISWYRGCNFDCTYCAFGKMLRLSKCTLCQAFEPHAHLEVLDRTPPKTEDGEFLTMGLSGDISFATDEEMKAAVAYCTKWNDRTFLLQTKSPHLFIVYNFPENVILDCTIESDLTYRYSTAPKIKYRHKIMTSGPIQEQKNRIWITVEPIMGFSKGFADWLEEIHPEVVYVGYDSKNHHLIEPSLEETMKFIEQVEKYAEVRPKLLRKAHWEK